jgi:hypothetical protein
MGRHTHTPVRQSDGRDVCSACSQVIINPIRTSDDPRLQDAGYHRSGGNQDDYSDMPPLPEVLLALYFNGPALGLPRAPVAPYIDIVAEEEGRRFEAGTSKLAGGPDYLWIYLYEGWIDYVEQYGTNRKR